ncbi:MAG: ATP-NAD kinase, partial [Candidatus Methanomethylicia archaeon]|nr:ATP-NAD kinase [Candidatus Methanomethylicia archaeon]
RMEPGVAYILGPGTTVKAICEELGVGCSLLGVDVLIDGKIVAKDANEDGIISAISGRRATIIVSPIGKQGFIFGRGNQQISSRVISAVGRGNVLVIATRDKLEGMDTLKVDTGSAEADGALSGTVKVLVDYNSFRVFRVSAASEVDPNWGDKGAPPK